MKYIVPFFLFLSFLFLIPKTAKSNYEKDSFSYYVILTEDSNFTTTDLKKIWTSSDLKILSLTPKVLPALESKIFKNSYKLYNCHSIQIFSKNYLKQIRELGLSQQFTQYTIFGIPIYSIEVYGEYSKLENLKKKYPNITYYKIQKQE